MLRVSGASTPLVQTGLFVIFVLFKCVFTSTHLEMDLHFDRTIHFSASRGVPCYGTCLGCFIWLPELSVCLPGGVCWCRCCGQSACVADRSVFSARWTTLWVFPLAVSALLCTPSGSVVDVESSSVPVCLSGTWSFHSFGLCSVWGAVWLWLLGVPLLEGLLVAAFYFTALVAWTLGHIILYFSLQTMHFLIPWMSVMFDTYTVLFLVVFFAFMFWFVKRFELWKSAV